MYIYKDYFATWMENLEDLRNINETQKKNYNDLWQWYKDADNGFNARFLNSEKSNNNSKSDTKNKR